MMLTGIGIFVLFVSTLAQRRLEKEESKLERRSSLGDNTKTTIKNKIEGIEKLTEEDFEILITSMRGLRSTLLANSILTKCPKCSIGYNDNPKFCSNYGLVLT
jgi:hypothetical protein